MDREPTLLPRWTLRGILSLFALSVLAVLVNALTGHAAPGGDHLWSKRFGASGTQFGTSVATDAAGNVYVAGGFAGTVDTSV
jgi:hypothetical protein